MKTHSANGGQASKGMIMLDIKKWVGRQWHFNEQELSTHSLVGRSQPLTTFYCKQPSHFHRKREIPNHLWEVRTLDHNSVFPFPRCNSTLSSIIPEWLGQYRRGYLLNISSGVSNAKTENQCQWTNSITSQGHHYTDEQPAPDGGKCICFSSRANPSFRGVFWRVGTFKRTLGGASQFGAWENLSTEN